MAVREKDIQLIGGHSPLIIATISFDGVQANLRTNGCVLHLARHGKRIGDNPESPEDGHTAQFYYDRSIRRLRAVIPKQQSAEMVGNYTYHLKVQAANRLEYRPEFGRANFIQGLGVQE